MRKTENEIELGKAYRKVKTLVRRAIKERDSKGYRENLGYDSQPELEDYLSGRKHLTYLDKCNITEAFFKACNEI